MAHKMFQSKVRVVNEWDDPNANVLNGKIKWRSGLRRKMSAFDEGAIIGTDKMDQIVRERLNRHTQRNKIGVASANTLKLKIFRKYDTDRSGNIDLPEFTEMLLGLGIRNVHQTDVDNLFDRYVKASRNGLLDYVQFSKLLVGDDQAHKEEGIAYMDSHQQVHKKQREQKGLASRNTRQKLLAQIKAKGMTLTTAIHLMQDNQGRIYKEKMKEVASSHFNLDPASVAEFFEALDEVRLGFLNHTQLVNGLHRQIEEPVKTPMNSFGKHGLAASSSKGVHALDQIVRVKLEKAMRLWYPVHSVSNPHILKACFERFDADNSGAIDRKEFTSLLLAIDVRGASQEDVNNLFNKYDQDGSGTIEYNEFCKKFVATFEQSRRGILHFPSSINAHEFGSRYMDKHQREVLLRDSFYKRLTDKGITPEIVCAKAVDRNSGMVKRSLLKSLLAYEYQIGIGLEDVLDQMFDRIDHKKNGQLYMVHIAQMFFPDLKYKSNKATPETAVTVAKRAAPLTARSARSSSRERITALMPKTPHTSRPTSTSSHRSTAKMPRPPQTARSDMLRKIAGNNQWVKPAVSTPGPTSRPVSRAVSIAASRPGSRASTIVYEAEPTVAKQRMRKKKQLKQKRGTQKQQARLKTVKFVSRIPAGASWMTEAS